MPLVLSGSTGIVEGNIADSAVTTGKIASLEASKLTGQVPDANAPSGSVIQISHTTYTGTTSTTSTTPVDVSGFSASITPISVNSRILISVSVVFGFVVDAYPYVLLRRNGTSIGTGVTAYGSNRINTFMSGSATNIGTMMWRVHQFSRNHLDSPNTTSALTYQIAFASPYAGYAGFINRQANADTIDGVYVQYPASSITLMEIAL